MKKLNRQIGQNQFNFTAGNFSECEDYVIEKFITLTNLLRSGEKNDSNDKEL